MGATLTHALKGVPMKIIAHRGNLECALENSWQAFSQAVAHGCDRIELDVLFSQDHHPYVIHDENLLRLTGVQANLGSLSAGEVDGIRLHNGDKIPTLESVLDTFGPHVSLNIELKSPEALDAHRVEALLLARQGKLQSVILSSFHMEPLRALKKSPLLSPDCALALLWEGPIAKHIPQIEAAMEELHATIIHPEAEWMDDTFIALAKKRGWTVFPWMGRKAEAKSRTRIWARLVEWKIPGFCTNFPMSLAGWLRMEEKWIKTRQGLRLRYGSWTSTPNPTRYVVCLTGRGESIEKYLRLPLDLQLPADTGCLVWEHRGQGASEGERFHVEKYEQFVEDLVEFLETAVGSKPYTILAHSMGSLIALYGVGSNRLHPEKMFLSAPLLGFPVSRALQALVKPGLELLCSWGWGTKRFTSYGHLKRPFRDNPFTHSEENFLGMRHAQYPSLPMTFSWLRASQEAVAMVFSSPFFAGLSMPIVIFLAEEERVVSNGESVRWISLAKEHAPSAPQVHWIPGARHELFFEAEPYYGAVLSCMKSKEGFRETACAPKGYAAGSLRKGTTST